MRTQDPVNHSAHRRDPIAFAGPFLQAWSSDVPTPEFVPGDDFVTPTLGLGFGAAATPDAMAFWAGSIRRVYAGDEGRKKLRMAVIAVAERDGLLLRLGDVKCPVHWLQVSCSASSISGRRGGGG